METIDTSE